MCLTRKSSSGITSRSCQMAMPSKIWLESLGWDPLRIRGIHIRFLSAAGLRSINCPKFKSKSSPDMVSRFVSFEYSNSHSKCSKGYLTHFLVVSEIFQPPSQSHPTSRFPASHSHRAFRSFLEMHACILSAEQLCSLHWFGSNLRSHSCPEKPYST